MTWDENNEVKGREGHLVRAQTRLVPTTYLKLQGCFSRYSGIQTMFQEEPTLNFLSWETKGGHSGKNNLKGTKARGVGEMELASVSAFYSMG